MCVRAGVLGGNAEYCGLATEGKTRVRATAAQSANAPRIFACIECSWKRSPVLQSSTLQQLRICCTKVTAHVLRKKCLLRIYKYLDFVQHDLSYLWTRMLGSSIYWLRDLKISSGINLPLQQQS